jgi:nucleotide-binding universal stress UspA family protein
MYQTIMVPLDGSSFGEYALPLALGIARRAGGRVELVHVCTPLDPNVFGGALDAPVLDETRLDQMRQRARSYVDQLATSLAQRWDVAMTAVVLDGPAADTLYDHALVSGADLVVMTTHGYGPLARAWMGSVADKLVRRLPMPILLARPHEEALDVLEAVHEHAFAHVLIPLDGSPLAEEVVEPALALGQLMDAEYTLLQAIEVPVLAYAPAAHAAGLDERVLEEWRAQALAGLERVASWMRERGVTVHTSIAYGQPAGAIIEYAREHAADLIALSTHGRGGVARLLLGSVADKVVRGAGVPVLVQQPGDEAAGMAGVDDTRAATH